MSPCILFLSDGSDTINHAVEVVQVYIYFVEQFLGEHLFENIAHRLEVWPFIGGCDLGTYKKTKAEKRLPWEFD